MKATAVPSIWMNMFKLLKAEEASRILPGMVMFLPPREIIPKAASIDPDLLNGAFNHPVVIISCPRPTLNTSCVEFVIMTSFHGTAIKKHVAKKGLKVKTGTLAARQFGYLRIVTESKPYAKDTLKLRNRKGMKRDFSYVNVKQSYKIELQALAQYGFKEEVDAYRLTAQATTKLTDALRSRDKRTLKMKGKVQEKTNQVKK